VSPPLAAITVHAGLAYAVGATASGVSAAVVSLTEGVLQAMFLSKLKMVLVVLLALGVVGTGFGLFLIRAEEPEKQDAKQSTAHAKAIGGIWKVVSGTIAGKEPPDADDVKKAPWVITADQIIVKREDRERESSYKLDPTKEPKTFDLTPLTGPDNE